MTKRYAVVLAAGQGTRMKSDLYKVLHPLGGKPMVRHVVDTVGTLDVDETIVVIGHGADAVREELGDRVTFVLQKEQLGTAHAVQVCESALANREGTTVVLYGDTPLVSAATIQALFDYHESTGAKATVLTAMTESPFGYGRVIRDDEGNLLRIVEEKDANEKEKQIREINTGIYCFDNRSLFEALKHVHNDNAQGEFYLPDVIEIFRSQKETVAAFTTDDFNETIGINDRLALAKAEKILRQKINERHMKNGVTLIDPEQTYIEADVQIGRDTVIYPNTIITGSTKIAEHCRIGPGSEIHASEIGTRSAIRQSVVTDSFVGADVQIGPFAHIRPLSRLLNGVKIGNFVEVKKSTVGDQSKASHLSYIGDAVIGNNVNLGCGSITVNYDGESKHLTKIEDGAFIGCNVNLVAPVKVGKNAFVAAGSTITEAVPAKALAIARSRQTNKENYRSKKKRRDP